ncbi:hypothetical protein H5410_055186 [Solanum commersonii]|uniref:Uncharacterized protein n=1 Tax=Solanum commersonii TaxID=4109 RepID=A0A9J5WIL2_SOLCO|nr:hypothetical protein H5410_055186 [Solanum commersonii]
MEQIVVNGSETQVVVDDSNLLQKKISAIRLGGAAKLQVNLTLLVFVLFCWVVMQEWKSRRKQATN